MNNRLTNRCINLAFQKCSQPEFHQLLLPLPELELRRGEITHLTDAEMDEIRKAVTDEIQYWLAATMVDQTLRKTSLMPIQQLNKAFFRFSRQLDLELPKAK